MPEPRELTNEEVRILFLQNIWSMIRYWQTERVSGDRIEGFAFSFLAMLDGSNVEAPKFIVAPDPHPEDRIYLAGNGENWYPESPATPHDIAGSLHELFHGSRP